MFEHINIYIYWWRYEPVKRTKCEFQQITHIRCLTRNMNHATVNKICYYVWYYYLKTLLASYVDSLEQSVSLNCSSPEHVKLEGGKVAVRNPLKTDENLMQEVAKEGLSILVSSKDIIFPLRYFVINQRCNHNGRVSVLSALC